MSTPADLPLHLVAPRRSVRQHLVDIWRYRELLRQLVRKELHVRYQKSVLGFIWSLVSPLFLLVIYTIVFGILNQSFSRFAVWIMAGLLPWTFFATVVSTSTQSITANAFLVGKINFPREILPLASAGAAFVHFLLSTAVFSVVLAVFRHPVDWAYLWLVIPAMAACVILASGLGILLSASNVYARDTTHLLELVLLAWFWLTPIVYTFQLVSDKLVAHHTWAYLHLLNPMTPIVITVQRAVYGTATIGSGPSRQILLPDLSVSWYLRNVLAVLALAIVIFVVAIKVFDRAEANFAEVM